MIVGSAADGVNGEDGTRYDSVQLSAFSYQRAARYNTPKVEAYPSAPLAHDLVVITRPQTRSAQDDTADSYSLRTRRRAGVWSAASSWPQLVQ
jgi:hypothetical protein